MAPQGAENDLKDVRFYDNASKVEVLADNEPLEDINDNILTIDNKSILAKTLANDAAAQLLTHIGGSGDTQHPDSTPVLSGFISTIDKAKLDSIQVEAKINILAAVDALELVGGGRTTLHRHISVSTVTDGFMAVVDKVKLNGIATGANVNVPDLADADALARDPGGDANALHTHVTPTLFETFRETGAPIGGVVYHDEITHAGLPGVPATFIGFPQKAPYNQGPEQEGPGITIFTHTYFSFSTLHVVTAGPSVIRKNGGVWGNRKRYKLTDVSISGLDGIVTYEIVGGNTTQIMQCWQGGFGE